MSLLSYQEARPWAKAIREAVITKKMPPWFADSQYGIFQNDARLTQAEIDTVKDWVNAGSPEGDPRTAPAPRSFVDQWSIGKPDLIVELPRELPVPATGKVEYVYVRIPLALPTDKWIERIEARPSQRAVVHHIDVYSFSPASSKYGKLEPGLPYTFPTNSGDLPQGADDGTGEAYGENEELIGGYIPGNSASDLAAGQARLLKRGSDLLLVVHYTPNGKATSDRSRVGFIFAKAPPSERVRRYFLENYRFRIPPNDPDFVVTSRVTLDADVTLLSLTPHMHFRGKSFEYRAVFPGGRSETLLKVSSYDFNWQLTYQLSNPLRLPRGTQIVCTAHYDNSLNNPHNPDPSRIVPWGEQTSDEMMTGILDLAVPGNSDMASIWRPANYSAKANLN